MKESREGENRQPFPLNPPRSSGSERKGELPALEALSHEGCTAPKKGGTASKLSPLGAGVFCVNTLFERGDP